MIKLIATDMDGTLLDSTKILNQEFFTIFEEIKEKKIMFVIASGNQFYHLYNQFLPVSDDLYFIAENGCYITKGKAELKSYCLKKEFVDCVIDILHQFPSLMPMICGKKKSYTFERYCQYEKTIQKHYYQYAFIEDIQTIDDEIFKFSIHDPFHQVENYVEDIKRLLPQGLKIVTSGHEWMDIQDENIHKGIGIEFLKNKYGITKEECVAFGDQMNDYELLQNVYYAYAMENAVKSMKDIAYEIVPSNEQQGVIQKLKELLKEM